MDLLDASITITLDYNSSHIELLLDNESLTVILLLFILVSSRLTASQLRLTQFESESYVTTDVQSASLSWNKASIWGLRPGFYYCQTVAGLLMWGALSDKRTGLSCTVAAGLSQRSHSRVRVPWDSRP
jgi:hypothetical protein